MKKSIKIFQKNQIKQLLLLGIFCLLWIGMSFAQDLNLDGNSHTITYSGTYKDYKVPTTTTSGYLYFGLKGGDGGKHTGYNNNGGSGATTSAYISVGSNTNQIPAGSLLRFIVGQAGVSSNWGGGGGGGTAVLLKKPGETTWTRLLVAGAGGGAGGDDSGKEGVTGTSGSSGSNPGFCVFCSEKDGGTNGGGGESASGGGGGGYRGNGDGDSGGTAGENNGQPIGGSGGEGSAKGGFGYGGGGGANRDACGWGTCHYGGGGGGYSGGGGGNGAEGGVGGGGGSYANPDYILSREIKSHGSTSNPANGNIVYNYSDGAGLYLKRTIRFGENTNFGIDDRDDDTYNGNNIQLNTVDASSLPGEEWIFDTQLNRLRLASKSLYCLDLDGGVVANARNIQLWECVDEGQSSHWNQVWIYDGLTKMIRSGKNHDYCLDLKGGTQAEGTNIQLYKCSYGNKNQVWEVNGATTPSLSSRTGTIRPSSHQDKCFDNTKGRLGNGNDIKLYTCSEPTGGSNQRWYFDGTQIKLNVSRNKCLDLDGGVTSEGRRIQLWDCQSGSSLINQQFVYDGLTQTFRVRKDPGMCITLENGAFNNLAHVVIASCDFSDAQKFIVE